MDLTALGRRAAGVGGGCGAPLPECLGELTTQPPVLLGECVVAFVGCLQAAQQGGVGGTLAGGEGARRVVSRSRRISVRMSGWVYSQDRETPAVRATVSNVTAVPVRSSS
jgi:hypothetical protein